MVHIFHACGNAKHITYKPKDRLFTKLCSVDAFRPAVLPSDVDRFATFYDMQAIYANLKVIWKLF